MVERNIVDAASECERIARCAVLLPILTAVAEGIDNMQCDSPRRVELRTGALGLIDDLRWHLRKLMQPD